MNSSANDNTASSYDRNVKNRIKSTIESGKNIEDRNSVSDGGRAGMQSHQPIAMSRLEKDYIGALSGCESFIVSK